MAVVLSELRKLLSFNSQFLTELHVFILEFLELVSDIFILAEYNLLIVNDLFAPLIKQSFKLSYLIHLLCYMLFKVFILFLNNYFFIFICFILPFEFLEILEKFVISYGSYLVLGLS
jgi:hypothetical protein